MSLLPWNPFTLSDPFWPEVSEPLSLFNQDFGLGLTPADLLPFNYGFSPLFSTSRDLSGKRARRHPVGARSEVINDGEKFQVCLDVPNYNPEEVKVKLEDNALIISAEHEERPDEHGHISRKLTRRYYLPRTVDMEKVESTLSEDGVLTVKCPKKQKEIQEKNVEIKLVPAQKQQQSVQGGQQNVGGQQGGQNVKIPVKHESGGGNADVEMK